MFKCNLKDCKTNKLDTQKKKIIYKSCQFCQKVYYCSLNCMEIDKEDHQINCEGSQDQSFQSQKSKNDQSITSEKKLKKSLNDYEFINAPKKNTPDLGKGSFGQIKLVQDKVDGKKYALKIFQKSDIIKQKFTSHLKREIKIQRKLDHPHIIKLYTSFEDENNVYLVLEYAQNGALFYYLRKKKKLSEKESFVYFFQTCMGIDYLHKKNIIHRDLKPENLLLDDKANIKLCDFGWSTEFSGQRTTYCGTLEYMSPEQLGFQQHDYKVDIWQLGIFLYELLHGYVPFKEKSKNNRIELLQEIEKREILYDQNVSEEAKNLIEMILCYDASQRPEIIDIIRHPWMKKHEKEFQMEMEAFLHKPKNEPKNNSNQSQDEKKQKLENIQQNKILTPKQDKHQTNTILLNEILPENIKGVNTQTQQLGFQTSKQNELIKNYQQAELQNQFQQIIPKPQIERKNSFSQLFKENSITIQNNDLQDQYNKINQNRQGSILQPGRSSSQGLGIIQKINDNSPSFSKQKLSFRDLFKENDEQKNASCKRNGSLQNQQKDKIQFDQPVYSKIIIEKMDQPKEKKSIRKGSIDKYKEELREANNVSSVINVSISEIDINQNESFSKTIPQNIQNIRSSSYHESPFKQEIKSPQNTIKKKKSIFEEIKLDQPPIQIPPIQSYSHSSQSNDTQKQNSLTPSKQVQTPIQPVVINERSNKFQDIQQSDYSSKENQKSSLKSPGKKIFENIIVNNIQPTQYPQIKQVPQKEIKKDKEFNISDLSVKERIQYFEEAKRNNKEQQFSNIIQPPLIEDEITTMLGNFINDYEKQNKIQEQNVNKINQIPETQKPITPKVIDNERQSFLIPFQDRFTNRATCAEQRNTCNEEMLSSEEEEEEVDQSHQPLGESSLNPFEKDESSFCINNNQHFPQNQNQIINSKQDNINFSQYKDIIINNNIQKQKQSYDPFFLDSQNKITNYQQIDLNDQEEEVLNYRPYLIPSQNQDFSYSSQKINVPLPQVQPAQSQDDWVDFKNDNNANYNTSQIKLHEPKIQHASQFQDDWVNLSNQRTNQYPQYKPQSEDIKVPKQNQNQSYNDEEWIDNSRFRQQNNPPQNNILEDSQEESYASNSLNESHSSSFVSKPSKRKKNIIIQRQIESKTAQNGPNQIGFLDKVKYTFGCLSRPQ